MRHFSQASCAARAEAVGDEITFFESPNILPPTAMFIGEVTFLPPPNGEVGKPSLCTTCEGSTETLDIGENCASDDSAVLVGI